jgi:hypothetical protein
MWQKPLYLHGIVSSLNGYFMIRRGPRSNRQRLGQGVSGFDFPGSRFPIRGVEPRGALRRRTCPTLINKTKIVQVNIQTSEKGVVQVDSSIGHYG